MSGLPPESYVQFVGPFQSHDVVVRGREVSFLKATPLDGGLLHLTLDRRFGLRLTVEDAERVVPFLANAIAVASGYTSHPDSGHEPTVRHPFPGVKGVILGEAE